MNVFLDTNVVIDFMGERKDFFASASTIFSMVEDGTIHASVSALTIINCAYILKKAFSQKVMLEKIGILCRLFKNGFSDFNIPILTPDEFVSRAKA